jgi:hypothetical protein
MDDIIYVIIGLIFLKLILDYRNLIRNKINKKLDIYWQIYYKLLTCLSAKIQIKNLNKAEINYNEIIIKNLDDIVKIISENMELLDVDKLFLDSIIRFISHVSAYKCTKFCNLEINCDNFPFPDDLTQYIINRILDLSDNKLNLKNPYLELEEINNVNIEFKNKLNDLDDDISIEINPDDINIDDIFINIYNNKKEK